MAKTVNKSQLYVLPRENGQPLPFLFIGDTHKTLRLTVQRDGTVIIKGPLKLRESQIFTLIRQKLHWIDKKRAFFLAHPVAVRTIQSPFYFLGMEFPLYPVEGLLTPRLGKGAMLIPAKLAALPQAHTLTALRRYEKFLAHKVLPKRFLRIGHTHFAPLFASSTPPRLTVQALKRRFGSAAAEGAITLAQDLIAAPLPCIDYVVYHELCHIAEHNHSQRFYALLASHLPHYKALQTTLHNWFFEHPRLSSCKLPE